MTNLLLLSMVLLLMIVCRHSNCGGGDHRLKSHPNVVVVVVVIVVVVFVFSFVANLLAPFGEETEPVRCPVRHVRIFIETFWQSGHEEVSSSLLVIVIVDVIDGTFVVGGFLFMLKFSLLLWHLVVGIVVCIRGLSCSLLQFKTIS